MHIPLLSMFAVSVSCAVRLQLVLTYIKFFPVPFAFFRCQNAQ